MRENRLFRITLFIIITTFLLSGCVAKSDYEEVSNKVESLELENSDLNEKVEELTKERDSLSTQLESVKKELDDIKNGPTSLLSEARTYFEKENYNKVIEVTSLLHTKFNGVKEDIEGQKLSKAAQKKLDEAAALKKKEEEKKAAEAKKSAQDKAREIIRVTKLSKSEPNSAGGVDVFIGFKNMSDKVIKYIDFTVTPYNAVGDKTYCRVRRDASAILSDTGPYKKGEGSAGNYDGYWENTWYNWEIHKIKLDKISIEYMDGTRETLTGEDVDYVQY